MLPKDSQMPRNELEELEMLIEAMRDQLTPIEFDALIRAGVLRRVSARRFEVVKPEELPRHVSRHAREASGGSRGKGMILGFASRIGPSPKKRREIEKMLPQLEAKLAAMKRSSGAG